MPASVMLNQSDWVQSAKSILALEAPQTQVSTWNYADSNTAVSKKDISVSVNKDYAVKVLFCDVFEGIWKSP